ncbi:hypothetical protein [Saccharopolyspora sp. ASAGF58]|uniref:hypothetical protein n=1 Tax=Saccharopolyspora sp. ASAGF58 TaxID=2719023 RepID=UPI001B30C110|nr:hypothetical protein [Saccharopolyspora sp. ASAGF58]
MRSAALNPVDWKLMAGYLDGAMQTYFALEQAAEALRLNQFAERVRTVVAVLAEQERDAAEFAIAKRVYVAVDETPERRRERINAALERLYGRRSSTIEAAAVARRPSTMDDQENGVRGCSWRSPSMVISTRSS